MLSQVLYIQVPYYFQLIVLDLSALLKQQKGSMRHNCCRNPSVVPWMPALRCWTHCWKSPCWMSFSRSQAYMIWYDMIWYDMIWYDMIWYDMIWYDMIWYDMIFKPWVLVSIADIWMIFFNEWLDYTDYTYHICIWQFLALFQIDDMIFHCLSLRSFRPRSPNISNSRRRIESFWTSQSAFGKWWNNILQQ